LNVLFLLLPAERVEIVLSFRKPNNVLKCLLIVILLNPKQRTRELCALNVEYTFSLLLMKHLMICLENVFKNSGYNSVLLPQVGTGGTRALRDTSEPGDSPAILS
jgi:hypothetical protein